jgi:hypothetical protein
VETDRIRRRFKKNREKELESDGSESKSRIATKSQLNRPTHAPIH